MVIINGVKYDGNSVSITNGVVIIDGVLQSGKPLSGVVRVEVTGNLASLRTDASVTMNGYVTGGVNAGGSITCGDVGGNVSAGGSINCGRVDGNVSAGGSVNHRR